MPSKHDLFKALVWDNLVKVGIQRLFLAAPWLGWGPVGWVASFIITHFADMLYETVKLEIELELIVIRNEAFRREYDAASTALKQISQDKGPDSDEFKAARKTHSEALSRFVRFNVAR